MLNFSKQIKELTVKEDLSERSYSQFDENDEGTDTVIENKEKLKKGDEEEKNSVEESLQKVNSILVEIDKELGNNNGDGDGLSPLSDDPNSDKKTFRYWDLSLIQQGLDFGLVVASLQPHKLRHMTISLGQNYVLNNVS